jgi:hypothetical protein
MGSFDTLKCEYPLPNATEEVQDSVFQTKSFDCCFKDYTVKKDGTLVEHSFVLEVVPEEERCYYGKPEWDESPVLRLAGALKKIPKEEITIEYTGIINIISCLDVGFTECYTYNIYFKNGKLTNIEEVT